jgi:hypothetical protein
LDLVVTAKRNVRHFIVLIFYTIEFREAESVRAGCPSLIAVALPDKKPSILNLPS